MTTTSSTYILALDQGTTSSRAILFDCNGGIVGVAQKEFTQIYPQPGWVEHNPIEIWQTQLAVARQVLAAHQITPQQIAAIGITNQRETTIAWDSQSGKPFYNAIVWQDRRTAAHCDRLKAEGWTPFVRQNTGLVIDAYFSGTKAHWILQNIPEAKAAAQRGHLRIGTVDTWLLWNLTNGKVFATDMSNASRTMLFNINTLQWDNELCNLLQVSEAMLPEVLPSSHIYGYTAPELFGAALPIAGIAGDQQAALFGQTCFSAGMAKNTYGTGCFMLMNMGEKPTVSSLGLLTTIAWGLNKQVTYALEGSVFIAGAAIQWLRDGLRLLDAAPDSEYFAMKAADSDGVYVVPAFAGLGAPYWDMYARGAVFGLTRGTNKSHFVRATLESLAYQSRDVLNAMEKDAQVKLSTLRVDGGASANNLLMQFQADILGVPVERPKIIETTALGAAYLAGLAVDYYAYDQLVNNRQPDRLFVPNMLIEERERRYKGWQRAVQRTMGWAKNDEEN